jgi:hypothetical protein
MCISVAMGEDIGTEMALRSLDNILQYLFVICSLHFGAIFFFILMFAILYCSSCFAGTLS